MTKNEIPTIGTHIRVTTRFREIWLHAKNKYKKTTYDGVVVPLDQLDHRGTFNITTGDPRHPVANIAPTCVVDIQIISTNNPVSTVQLSTPEPQKKKEKTYDKRWKVASSTKKGKFYFVTKRGSAYQCECTGFTYHHRCSHIDSILKFHH